MNERERFKQRIYLPYRLSYAGLVEASGSATDLGEVVVHDAHRAFSYGSLRRVLNSFVLFVSIVLVFVPFAASVFQFYSRTW